MELDEQITRLDMYAGQLRELAKLRDAVSSRAYEILGPLLDQLFSLEDMERLEKLDDMFDGSGLGMEVARRIRFLKKAMELREQTGGR